MEWPKFQKLLEKLKEGDTLVVCKLDRFVRQDPHFKDGRPKKCSLDQLALRLMLLEQRKTYRQIRAMTGISKSTLIRERRSA